MIIDPKVFSTRMEQHWTEKLGNISNEPLRQTWEQIAKSLNEHIRYHDDPELSTKWHVLQPPTGSGKTQSLILYSSLLAELPKEEHPGVLIVTRRIKDCNKIVEQINRFAKTETAISYHSEANVKLSGLKEYPVIVITHKAYENALDYLGDSAKIKQTWPYFHSWVKGTRKLVVIDECIGIVEFSQANLEGLRQTLAAIPERVQLDYPKEVGIIKGIIQILEDASKLSKEFIKPIKETMMAYDEQCLKQYKPSLQVSKKGTDISSFIKGISKNKIRFDLQNGKNDSYESGRLKRRYIKCLKELQSVLQSWRYYSGVERGGALHTARLLIPEGVKGAVVLDATASTNAIYQLHKDSCIIPTPDGTRNYHNVTLHVSRGHKLGKVYMKQNAKKFSKEIISELNVVLRKENKALVITHKDVEAILNKQETTFDMKTSYWGAIDGSNEWRDCDTAVIFGLPYLPEHWSADVYMALQGCTSTEWLQNSDKRAFDKYDDIRQALRHGQIITNVVQGINRVRCRKVIDTGGNCEETHVYLLLPSGSLADEMLDSIQSLMPGIKVTEWDYTGNKKKPKSSKHEACLIKHLQNMQPGSMEALGYIGMEIGSSPSTMNRMSKKAKDPKSKLSKAMEKHSVKLELYRVGRTQKLYFKKLEFKEVKQIEVDENENHTGSSRVKSKKPLLYRNFIAGFEELKI